jgi:hypothetical protein
LLPEGTLVYDTLDNETDVNGVGGTISNVNFVSGKYAKGALMESASTNLLANPNFENNTSEVLDNWTYVGTPAYNTTNASNTTFGVAAVKVNINNYFRQSIGVTANATYTLSAYMKGDNGILPGRLHINWLDSSQGFISNNICVGNCTAKPTVNTSLERYQTQATAPSNAAYAQVVIDGGNLSYVWVDAIQLEQKLYASSFVSGAKADSILTYDTNTTARDNFNPVAGTLEMWVRPEWDGNDAGIRWFFSEYYDGGNYFILRKKSSAQLTFEINTSFSHIAPLSYELTDWIGDSGSIANVTFNGTVVSISNANATINATDNVTLYKVFDADRTSTLYNFTVWHNTTNTNTTEFLN